MCLQSPTARSCNLTRAACEGYPPYSYNRASASPTSSGRAGGPRPPHLRRPAEDLSSQAVASESPGGRSERAPHHLTRRAWHARPSSSRPPTALPWHSSQALKDPTHGPARLDAPLSPGTDLGHSTTRALGGSSTFIASFGAGGGVDALCCLALSEARQICRRSQLGSGGTAAACLGRASLTPLPAWCTTLDPRLAVPAVATSAVPSPP